ncbi:MAG TPA: alcohol dehydrogenase catalytic domain-containing protein [Anaerolineaceae bacterium]|nr:alcohol dehydrogenase catalytic domain-containing protein [Anaerolineaceae bacterium]HPN52722.1 alcohol dehydrogenase catalytic domain-containing protein [Anaerolineaceae bacterium]
MAKESGKMKAIWLENQKISFRRDVPAPVPGEGEALIRMIMSGVCSTDLELIRGYYPYTGVPGHEFVGEVVEAPGAEEWIGKRVAGEINLTCGVCPACLKGRSHHCLNRTVLGIMGHSGSMAEELVLPVKNLIALPDQIPNEEAVFVEPLAAAVQVLEQVHIAPGMRVVVVGAGRLGQLIARCLKLTGCDLKVVVRRESARKALEIHGIKAVAAEELTNGSADVVVEATGSAEGFDLSRRLVRAAGILVLKSTFAGDVSVNLSSLVVDEITVVGSRCGEFNPAVRLMAAGLVNCKDMIDSIYPLDQGVAAFERAAMPGILKVVLTP